MSYLSANFWTLKNRQKLSALIIQNFGYGEEHFLDLVNNKDILFTTYILSILEAFILSRVGPWSPPGYEKFKKYAYLCFELRNSSLPVHQSYLVFWMPLGKIILSTTL